MDIAKLEELFQRTLIGDYDDDAPWEAVSALQRIGTRDVFDKAVEWCGSKDALARARGVAVLAQLGRTPEHPATAFGDEAYPVILQLLSVEQDELPLSAAITALGHLDNPASVSTIIRFRDHPNSDVRHAVAFALGQYANEEASTENLLLLMRDRDEDVRDWATFGLGVLGTQDSPEIRDALTQCLSDPDEDVREEAMVGLSKRKDPRVLEKLLAALDAHEVSDRSREAASFLLDIESAPEGWSAEQYRAALKSRFEF